MPATQAGCIGPQEVLFIRKQCASQVPAERIKDHSVANQAVGNGIRRGVALLAAAVVYWNMAANSGLQGVW